MSAHPPLCIAHVDAETGFSGGEVQVFLLMEGLRTRGYSNVLLSPPGSRAAAHALDRGFEACTVRMRGDLDIGAVVEMSRALREIGPDLVHLHTGRATWLGGLAARAAELPAITTRRMDRRVHRSWRTRLVYGRLVRCAVAISPAVRDCLERGGVGPARILVVPSAIDPARIVPLRGRDATRAELGARADQFVLLTLAALVPRKGIDVLIDALHQIASLQQSGKQPHNGSSRPDGVLRGDVVAWVAGDGPLRAELEARAQELGVPVAFLGRREDAGDLLAACDALVLPARREGLGVSALEAMAAARPVVASRVGGLAEAVVHERTGLLVPPDDARALAEAIMRLGSDRDLARRLGDAGPMRVAEGFLPEQMVSAYTEIYAGVLAGARARA
jgi:glycosyltransferase involved in cell wall biosynthesis